MHQDIISVVIPVYNAEDTLVSILDRLTQTLSSLAGDYEIVVVNDGSRDNSWSIIETAAQANPRIKGFSLARNYGQHNATIAGIRAAQGNIIVTIDSDGQHPPEEIGKLLDTLQQGYDLVYGYAEVGQHEWWRNPINVFTKWVIEKGHFFPDASKLTAFRAFHVTLRDAFEHCQIPYPIVDVLLRWGTNRVGFVSTRHAPRQAGRSSSNLANLLTAVIHLVTAHSIILVRWVELVGIAMILAGLLGMLGKHVPEGLILLGDGVIVMAIGIVGEYVARTYHLGLGKPQSILKTKTSSWK